MMIKKEGERGQNAIEYMILLGIVTAVVMLGFKTFIPRINKATEVYFNTVSNGIMGAPPNSRFFDDDKFRKKGTR